MTVPIWIGYLCTSVCAFLGFGLLVVSCFFVFDKAFVRIDSCVIAWPIFLDFAREWYAHYKTDNCFASCFICRRNRLLGLRNRQKKRRASGDEVI